MAPEHDYLLLALTLVLVANVCNEVAQAFYNAMLPDLAPRPARALVGLGLGARLCRRDRGAGADPGRVRSSPNPPPFGLDAEAAEQVRITGPLLAVWFLLFSLPLFLVTPDRPSHARPFGGERAARASPCWSRRSRTSARNANIARFLLARLIYNDGLNTLFAFGGIYAAGTFGMTLNEVLLFGIALNVTAGLGAFGLPSSTTRSAPSPRS